MFRKQLLMLVILIAALVLGCGSALADFASDPDAIEIAANSVLMLEVYNSDDVMIATGSGFVAFDSQTLVTNHHVIEDGAWMVGNTDDGRQYIIRDVITGSEHMDIAICRFEQMTDLTPLELSPVRVLKRAETVVAIGSPEGIKNTVSLGNISAIYEEDGVPWIQFTAPISHGSSGGALFDSDGLVIGITSATYVEGQNLNLAVRISEVTKLYEASDGSYVSIEDFLSGGGSRSSIFSTPAETPAEEPEDDWNMWGGDNGGSNNSIGSGDSGSSGSDSDGEDPGKSGSEGGWNPWSGGGDNWSMWPDEEGGSSSGGSDVPSNGGNNNSSTGGAASGGSSGGSSIGGGSSGGSSGNSSNSSGGSSSGGSSNGNNSN